VAPPVVLLSYFELDDLLRLLDAVEPAGIPSTVPVYVGSYGVSREASGLIRSLAQGRYAPMFPVQPGTFWELRRAPDVPDDAYIGRIPSFGALMRLSAQRRVAWGRELGRRYRDSIRAARREGVRVDAWQFDELLGQAARSGGRGYREFLRGVLAGLTFGRPQLNDREERGFVWSHSACSNSLPCPPTPSWRRSGSSSTVRASGSPARSIRASRAIRARPRPPTRGGNACSRGVEPLAGRSLPSIWRG